MKNKMIIWSAEASSDIFECFKFVKNISEKSAINLFKEVKESVNSLIDFPERNPVFKHIKMLNITIRKLVINKRYLVLYHVDVDKIVIDRVLDSRRNFGSLL